MNNIYFKAMSVIGCEIGGITRRSLCRHNCCDGENCVTWLEKQFAKLNEYEEAKADGRVVELGKEVSVVTEFNKCQHDEKIINAFISGEWCDTNDICRLLKISFADGLKCFDFSRTAEWNATPLEGQKITTKFRIKQNPEPPKEELGIEFKETEKESEVEESEVRNRN